ncbi:hypothetical protein BCR32DRAFT_269844 [Anaeromyces robustus]|jgi:hypothetical protein|uniref:Uncharacterized protein n=1 Tax=Anaeromyces robustus TaxID=1754192 RepID=A0A1Y1WZL8_9FUNG|nr:hypothetical protein BCR32DRAFT_269844 [Anaeromyces robustus]|eukprot:ORX78835.1 hypothetical protein BCR32DRAFT_269844 [Anaeromyces robustus]
MAKFHLTSVLLIVKAISVFAASKEGSVRIFPNVEQNIRSISFPELDGIVSHMVGVESEDASYAAVNDKAIVNAASDIFNKPKANLLISVDGVDSDVLSDKVAYSIPSSDAVNAEGMAAFELEVAYKLAEAESSDSMVVLLSNEENECKEGQYKTNVVRVVMKEDDVSLTGHPYNKVRKAVASMNEDIAARFNDLFKTTVFDEKKKADNLFMKEMVYIHDILSTIKEKANDLVKDENKDFFGIVSDSAKKIYENYGVDSEQYKEAQAIVKKTVDNIVKEFQEMYENGVAEVITTPASIKAKRNFRAVKREEAAAQCKRVNGYSRFATAEECNKATNNCNNRGSCVAENVREPGCFSCKCNADNGIKYGGNSCEAEDISAKFNLLFWTAVILIVTLILMVGIMFDIKSDIPIVGAVSHQKTN